MATDQQRLDALLDSITPMNEMQKYFRFLLYGEGGVGKTVASASLVKDKGLYIEVDPLGWVSLQNHPGLADRLDHIPYMGLSQLDALSLAFERGEDRVMQYDTIIIDTLSAIASLDLDTVYNVREHKDILDPAFGAPTLPDIGVNTHRVRKTVTRLINQPVNIVFTAHVREDTDKATGVMYTRPNFTPQVRRDVERYMTLVGYMTQVEKSGPGEEASYIRKIQVHPTRTISAKSRIGGLPVILVEPDLRKIALDWLAQGNLLEDDLIIHPDSMGLKPEPPISAEHSNEPDGELRI